MSNFTEKRTTEEIELNFNSYKNHFHFLNITLEIFQIYKNDQLNFEYFLNLSSGDIFKIDKSDNNRITAKYKLGTSELFNLRIGYFLLKSEQSYQFNEVIRMIIKKIKESAPYSKLHLEIEKSFPLRSFISGFKSENDYQTAQNFFQKRDQNIPYFSNLFDKNIIKLLTEKVTTNQLILSLIYRFKELIAYEESKKNYLNDFSENNYFSLTEASK